MHILSAIKEYIGKKIDALLIINHLIIENFEDFFDIGYNIYKGKCFGEYQPDSTWLNQDNELRNYKCYIIKTKDGDFLVGKDECEKNKVKIGDNIYFVLKEFTLAAWQPSED